MQEHIKWYLDFNESWQEIFFKYAESSAFYFIKLLIYSKSNKVQVWMYLNAAIESAKFPHYTITAVWIQIEFDIKLSHFSPLITNTKQ